MIRRFLARILRIAPRRPTGHPPFAFTDQQGRHYYGWEDFAKMPPARANEVDDVLRETLDCYDDQAIEEGDLAAIGLVLDQFNHAVADRRIVIGLVAPEPARMRAL